MTFSTINATLCTGSAARAQHTRSSINVRQKAYILHQRRFGGLFLQLPHSRVRAATGANKITFLEMYAKSGVDATSRILHQADVQVWALRSSLCLRTVSWLVARISWAYFRLTCLCRNYLLDASEWCLRLCAASFRTYFWDAGPIAAMACMSVCAEQFLLSSRKVGPYSTGMTNLLIVNLCTVGGKSAFASTCLTRWNSQINDNRLCSSLRTLTTLTSRMESKCHVVLFSVDILGSSSHPWIHWETRCLQFGTTTANSPCAA